MTLTDWIIAGATVATALFTGWSAWIAHRERGGSVIIDAHPEIMGEYIRVRLSIRNSTTRDAKIRLITVRGLAVCRFHEANGKKHESWPTCDSPPPHHQPIQPGQTTQVAMDLYPDWKRLERRIKLPHARLINLLGRLIYRSSRALPSGGKAVWFGASGKMYVTVETFSKTYIIPNQIKISPGTIMQKAPKSANA